MTVPLTGISFVIGLVIALVQKRPKEEAVAEAIALLGQVGLSTKKDLAVEGWTLVIVTHEIQFAKKVSSQVLLTDGGIILEKGPPGEVIGNPKEERTRQFLDRVLNPL
ncbi:hypothetical protein MSAR_12810 [Mycolicibacterium sarraceniae]|uniref:ABC transporter ATP-binding protein n=1 Tax=Mycolicibacterium sarraceniae TaxID=1534348 RepID=A0A7I7SQ24_9MYCO|nr:hypothetical protein MSAR_12810 [Mycolicibacterium sarraceniae]